MSGIIVSTLCGEELMLKSKYSQKTCFKSHAEHFFSMFTTGCQLSSGTPFFPYLSRMALISTDCYTLLERQSFSALNFLCCARARAQPENLRSRSRSFFSRPCARALNVLSAAQFCAHFKILKSFRSN